MSRQILAIDIRNDAISAILLNTGLKTGTLQECACIAFSDAAEAENRLSDALQVLHKRFPIENTAVVIALPSDQVFYRAIRLPFSDDNKIRQILPFELEPSLPIPIDQLVVDFYKGAQNETTQLLATAIEQKLLEHYLHVFSEASLNPLMVAPGSFPIALMLMELDDRIPEQALVLDVDQQKATLFALVAGQITMVRTLPSGIDSESKIESFALRVRQTLAAFADASETDFSPAMVYLCGPVLTDHDKTKALVTALELPTKAIDLCAYLPKIEGAASLENWNPWQFDNALALALLEAENKPCPAFKRSSSPFRSYWTIYKSYVKGPAILLALVALIGLIGVWLEGHLLQKRVANLDAQMEQIFKSTFPNTARVKVPAYEQMKSELTAAKKNSIDSGQSAPTIPNIELLLAISQSVPKEINIVLDRMVVGEESVTISGEAGAFNMVDDIKGRLEKIAIFKQVTISSANMDKSGQKVHFKLKIDL